MIFTEYVCIYSQRPGGLCIISLIARFMGPTWGPAGADMTLVGLMLATWNLLSGLHCCWCPQSSFSNSAAISVNDIDEFYTQLEEYETSPLPPDADVYRLDFACVWSAICDKQLDARLNAKYCVALPPLFGTVTTSGLHRHNTKFQIWHDFYSYRRLTMNQWGYAGSLMTGFVASDAQTGELVRHKLLIYGGTTQAAPKPKQ